MTAGGTGAAGALLPVCCCALSSQPIRAASTTMPRMLERVMRACLVGVQRREYRLWRAGSPDARWAAAVTRTARNGVVFVALRTPISRCHATRRADAHRKPGARGLCYDHDRPLSSGPDHRPFHSDMGWSAQGHARARGAGLSLRRGLSRMRHWPALPSYRACRFPRAARLSPALAVVVQGTSHLPRSTYDAALVGLR